jgi:hypothetical protein
VRLVNTKAHALVDYLLGLFLVTSGWWFGFHGERQAETAVVIAGIYSIVSALFTAFEYSLAGIIPLKLHFAMDVGAGALLAASPWLFLFHEQAFKPHLVFGLTMMIVSLLTDRVLFSHYRQRHAKSDPS